MEPHELRLWEILQRAGKINHLPEDDLVFAEACLDKPPFQAQANACEILFRCSRSESARCRALDKLQQLCTYAAEEDYVVTLHTLMLYVPLSAFTNMPDLREFAFRSAGSSRWQIRTNAASVLLRITKTGDPDALELLRLLTRDSNSYVSANARNAIQRFGDSV